MNAAWIGFSLAQDCSVAYSYPQGKMQDAKLHWILAPYFQQDRALNLLAFEF